MADARRFSTTPQLDIEKILLEAQSRWLRPAEIVEILRNYQNFRIAPEPPNRPPSGSLFLFDRKVLRYFRKDGHNWRKKKDGKTVKEAHEKLKDGSIDVLHCYYAHGEENEKFQRRTYWMLEEEFTHIVLVHYREVQTGRAAYGQSADSEENFRNIKIESPASSNSMSNHHLVPSRATGTESPNSSQTNEYEDIDSDNHQASSRYHPHPEPQLQFRYGPVNNAPPYIQEFAPDTQGYYPSMESEYDPFSHGRMTNDLEGTGNPTGGWSMNGSPHQDDLLPSWGRVLEHCTEGSSQVPLSAQIIEKISSSDDPNVLNAGSYNQEFLQVNAEGGAAINRPADYGFLLKQLSLDNSRREGESGLKKYDSFTRWMSKELEEVDESDIKMGPSVNWETVVSEGVIEDSGISRNEDAYLLGPSLAQDQLFSILDFSPNWCYAGIETPVRIMGTFLTDQSEASYIKWSCMFGEVEVPVEISNNGILLCRTPPHKPGRVPFYITCSNRLACSEIREFEYRLPGPEQALFLLHLRFESILSLNHGIPRTGPILSGEKLQLSYKIDALLKEDDEWSNMLRRTGDPDPFPVRVLDPSRERVLKEKLATWLIYKIAEEGKGPAVLDREGQGVIHLAAALGYDWALQPTIVAGVSIDFRDVHGWTALHWAAFCGREKTVGVLFSLGAAPGVVTDPSPEFPSGRTPADLASANGHKGIAGFLAESSLTKHLNTLTLKDQGSSEVAQMQAEDVARKSMLRMDDGNMEAGLSAFRNAAQTAARIHQVFRIHSFQRKKISENDYGPSKGGMSDERALSLVTVKSKKSGDAAATQIQKKFRGWKGRKEFLTIRQHVVKIQAHVRGHQVRKHYRKIVWTVGIVEKVILRWRRKGPGLRNIFKSEGSTSSPQANTLSAPASAPAPEDDYDFLKEGRKQTEARLAKALDRVKSMVQYPEARDQYRRLLTVVEDYQESRAVLERVLNDPEVMENEPMFDIDELLGDDTYMPM